MELFLSTPPALTVRQKWLVAITAVIVAVTRLWARSRTLWDWDEALFSMAVHDFDVTAHHPHPPGFPLYVGLAKVARLLTSSDFAALQTVTTAAAIALFPLLYWLARELRFPFTTAYFGALIFVFLPNVWFYGGTGFSDITGLALLLAACATLLCGCRSRRAYFIGALLLGLAAAVRPQALAVGCAPALIASWCRIREKRPLDVAGASAIGLAIIGISYGSAALASNSVEGYFASVRSLREYVRKVDSFLNPDRAPVISLLDDFFIRVIPGGRVSVIVSALAGIAFLASLVRRAPRVWVLVAMFLPFNLIGLFMLDTNSISRYAVGFCAMYALLAAEGISSIFRLVAARRPTLVLIAETVVVTAIVGRMVWWTAPALQIARTTISPPVAAAQWILRNVPPTARLSVHGSMGPWTDYMLAAYRPTFIAGPGDLPLVPTTATDWYLTEGSTSVAGGHNFVRERGTLFRIARQRYFEVSVAPASSLLQFGRGWYDEEGSGNASWRWMSGSSELLLPPAGPTAQLSLGFDLPTELVPRRPTVEVRLNGIVVDRFVCSTLNVHKRWTVPARSDSWNKLEIVMDKVLNPKNEGLNADARDLGLNLTSYSWGAGAP